MADRFSGWVSVYYFSREATAKDLIKILREHFMTLGTAEEISTDSGPQFISHEFSQFLKTWGVRHRKSSEYNAHSNLRAETGVKTAKRLLMTATKSDGSPDWDMVAQALLQHRNTPVKDIGFSPAQLLFGRPIKDTMPVRPGNYNPSDVWVNCREQRELALRHKVIRDGERWDEHSRSLPPLTTGQHVFIQNQKGAGKQAKRWDRTGIVVEDSGHDKYAIRVDGSGRVLQRNRRYLRSFKPMIPQPTMPSTSSRHPEELFGGGIVNEDRSVGGAPRVGGKAADRNIEPVVEPSTMTPLAPQVTDPGPEPNVSQDTAMVREPLTQVGQHASPLSSPGVRKSNRIRKPNVRYNTEDFELSGIHIKERRN